MTNEEQELLIAYLVDAGEMFPAWMSTRILVDDTLSWLIGWRMTTGYVRRCRPAYV